MTDGKKCPKCTMKDLNSFCGEKIKQLDGGPKITTEEWDKTHEVPEMIFCGNFSSDNKGLDIDAYQCPDCGYVEFWGGMRAKSSKVK